MAHLDYTYGTNGIPVPAGQPWLVNLIDLDRILADAHAAKAAGAEVVVVEMHWGNENQSPPPPSNGRQARRARRLARRRPRSSVSTSHVVQAAERHGDEVRRVRHRELPLEPGAADHADGVATTGSSSQVRFDEQPDGS